MLLDAGVVHAHTTHTKAEHTFSRHRCTYPPTGTYIRYWHGAWLNTEDGMRTCCGFQVVTENVFAWACCWKAHRANAYGCLQCLEKCAVALLYYTGSYRQSLTGFVKCCEAKYLQERGNNSLLISAGVVGYWWFNHLYKTNVDKQFILK